MRTVREEDVLAFLHAAIAAGGAALTDRVPLVIRSAPFGAAQSRTPGTRSFSRLPMAQTSRPLFGTVIMSFSFPDCDTRFEIHPSSLPPMHRAKAAETCKLPISSLIERTGSQPWRAKHGSPCS
ncbi:MAG: hypothetical protein IPK07_24645 [Deltaproteobacteria bacterium]|nr:hypothetical protein [Deltaproteobacteria bacterium]